MRKLWAKIALSALTAIRPFVRMSEDEATAWESTTAILRLLAR